MVERAAPPRERFTIRHAPLRRSFAEDVRDGLSKPQKELQPWYFYDALGSALFGAICELPEYYLTRAETAILQTNAAAIAQAFGRTERLVELGSGNSRKTRILLEALGVRRQPLKYVPVDVDDAIMESSARALLADFPALSIEAIRGDYRDIAATIEPKRESVLMFLGSSVGNLDPESAASMLRDLRPALVPGNRLFLGADLRKAKEIVEPAYDDPLGVTAAFNLNLLARINRELGGHFDLAAFQHRAFFNERESRIEMHLVSREKQAVDIDAPGLHLTFDRGETIHTENSYKYGEDDLRKLAREGGFEVEQVWTDSHRWFADVLMVVR
jgi:L-histidine Nalpha-methyltransferase